MIGKVLQHGLKGDFGDQRVQNDDLPMISVTDVSVITHVLFWMCGGCLETSSS